MAVIVYCRVSTTNQQQPGHVSLDAQEQQCVEYTVANGLRRPSVVVKEVGSAYNGRQERLDQAIDMLRRGDTLLVSRFDRFGRNIAIATARLMKIQDKGAMLRSVHEEPREFGNAIQAAELEAKVIGINVQRSIAYLRGRGSHIGPAPFGFDVQRVTLPDGVVIRKLVPNGYEQSIKELIRLMCSEDSRAHDILAQVQIILPDADLTHTWVEDADGTHGAFTDGNIATFMNDLGILRRGKRWSAVSVAKADEIIVVD